MLCDGRDVQRQQILETTVCIIGSGPAGLTIALELEKAGIDCIVLESGGHKPEEKTMDLYRGDNVGLRYEFADGQRSRFLGGSSNCWGGWCRPLEDDDFEARDWVPKSGWPFSRSELMPYYSRAHHVLSLGPENFDADYWVKAINRSDVRRLPLKTGRFVDNMSQFSKPTRFGKHYRQELESARFAKIYLYANVSDIVTEQDGQKIHHVEVKTLTGNQWSVKAKTFVLAAGGIENPRLLLAANKQHEKGIGNQNDLVGRYFMEHPRLILHKAKFQPEWLRNKLYDSKYHYLNRTVRAGKTFVAAQMALTPEVRAREKLLNARVWFWSVFPGEDTDAANAIIRMKFRLHGKVDPQHSAWKDLATLIREPINAASFVAARQLPLWMTKDIFFKKITHSKMQMICEPTPEKDSRVTLSTTDRDELGMPRVVVNWQLSEQVKHTFDRTLELFADELKQSNIADVTLEPPLSGRPWPKELDWTWHHMGTTRMDNSPSEGVVDSNCKVHGISNLYVAGSSVFPTAGANFPTFTLVALSLRLSDHLKDVLKQPAANLYNDKMNPVEPALASS